MFFIGCGESDKIYTLKYVIFYPTYADTVIAVNDGIFCSKTDRDGNYIKSYYSNGLFVKEILYHNTAPFKILEYTYTIKK
jgi:hypothetical protein